jgi:hypothetical protein
MVIGRFPWKERGFTQAEQSSQPLDGTTLKCNRVRRQKHIRDLMPETGVWATDNTEQQ